MRILVDAPAGMDPLDVAQLYVGDRYLLKADPHQSPERALRKQPELRKMLAGVTRLYEKSMREAVAEIKRYVDSELKPARKAAGDSAPGFATPEQMAAIYEILKRHHAHVVVEALGVECVPPDVLADLKARGMVPAGASVGYGMQVIERAHEYGRRAARMPPPIPDAARRPRAGDGDPPRRPPAIPPPPPPPRGRGDLPDLTRSERLAVDYAKQRAGQYLTGLNDRVARDVHGLTVEQGEAMRAAYREGIAEAIAQRKAWGAVKSELGHGIGEWCRDLDRVVATEIHGAYQHGKAGELRELHGDPMVFKRPAPDACPACVALHLTSGPGSNPRLFKLSELEANGTNVGRRRASWKAVIDTVHPWCACELVHMPSGFAFDEDGDMVPESMLRSAVGVTDLRKGDKLLMVAPDHGCFVDIRDPRMSTAVQAVIDEGPPEIFHRDVGVTIITNDYPRPQNHLTCEDKAYQVGNEIRLSFDLPLHEVRWVVRHELGHGLNVYLKRKFGDTAAVRAWHDELYALAKREGFVSHYAESLPIENAAEVTASYVWAAADLARQFPLQYAFAHAAYRKIFAP